MKTIVTGLLIGAFALIPIQAEQPLVPLTPQPAEQSAPPEKSTIIVCVIGGLVIVVGVVVVIGLVKMCKKLPPIPPPEVLETNQPTVVTNKIPVPPIRHAANGDGTDVVVFQQRESLSDEWQDAYTFQIDQQMNCVVYQNGTPVLTNSAPTMVMKNGELQAWYDFRSIPLTAKTNGFFRLLSPQ